MTDSTTDAPTKRTSRLRQPPPGAETGEQEPAAATLPTPPAAVVPPEQELAKADLAQPAPAQPEVAPPAPPVVPVPAVPPPAFVLREAAPARPTLVHQQHAAVPEPGLEIPGSSLRKHDVVQINQPNHPFYGLFFVVGDVLRGKVHGYHMVEGHGKKEYITVDASAVWHIGASKVRSQNPCSPKWISDNRPQ